MDNTNIVADLSCLISIKSVSANPKMTREMEKAVIFISRKLESLNFKVEYFQKNNQPKTILARLTQPNATRTIGIYGHYDVQPEDPINQWSSDPFVLTPKNGKLYGRGVADNKGHIIQNITAIENLLAKGQLKSNVVFLIEGEEEVGSPSMERFISDHRGALGTVDTFFITDVEMYRKGVPQIIYSLRGMVHFDLELNIGKNDLHSGIYGNAVPNPAQILADLLSKMKDMRTGEVLIPGFYDDVREIGKGELEMLKKYSVSDDEFISEVGAINAISMRGVPSYLAPKLFPSLDVHGFHSGYGGDGSKTIIPSQAQVKFSCRLVENQNSKKIEKLVKDFITDYFEAQYHFSLGSHLVGGAWSSIETGGTTQRKAVVPQLAIKSLSNDNPFYCSVDSPYIQKVARILTTHFGHETVFMREGGSIPVAEIIQRILRKPVILTGFTLSDSNLHAPNENFDEEMFFKGIGALEKIYS